MEYCIWCDESIKKGKYYSNFYGGVLVQAKDLKYANSCLENVCKDLFLKDELKWNKVSTAYLEKYKKLMDEFFRLLKSGKVKIRIMFTQNAEKPLGLTNEHLKNEYFILYYQFFKHAFGLQYSNPNLRPIYIRAYFDNLPDTLKKRQQFKEYIKGLQSQRAFQQAHIKFRKDDITEVDSKDHLLLQCLDIVLGSMAFRLNDMHKEKQEGQRIGGKKTVAKEKLYKHIYNYIRETRPRFNIGVSTGIKAESDKWEQPYRHWKFTATNVEIDESFYK